MTREGELVLDLDDEILDGACVTHAGVVRHEPTRLLLEGPGAPVEEE
jgi:NAD(P) transhydrogenase subunit alpha